MQVKSSAGAVKVAILHKPIRGRRAGANKANQKTAASDSSQQERQRATMSGTLSTSASSLGSELVEESILDSSRNPVWEALDQRRADDSLDRPSSNGDQKQGAGKALTSDAAAAKARNPKTVRNIFSDARSANTRVALRARSTLLAVVNAVVLVSYC